MSPKGIYERKPFTEEHKMNLKKAHKRCKNHPSQFEKGNIPWNKNKKMSKEFCENTSKGHLGQIAWNKDKEMWSKEERKQISERNKGQISSMKGKTHSKETKEKISKSKIGSKMSKETKKKKSVAMKKAYAEGRGYNPKHGCGKSGTRKDIGHYVRSSWEANIARILNFNNIKYDYEPKRFDLGELGTYLPDFYLPKKDLWIEVKGWFQESARKKVEIFQENHNLLLIDKKSYFNLKSCYKCFIPEWEDYD